MVYKRNNLRYYYWLTIGFISKNFKLIVLSFIVTAVGTLSFISISPYVLNIIIPKKEVIGMIGRFSFDNLPDEILVKISNGLLYIDDKGQFVPAIASSWEIKDNGREYRIHLKKDLFWNDGKPFTVKDVGYKFIDVEMTSSGDYLIDFKLKKPLAIFPSYLTKPIIKYPVLGVAGLYQTEKIKRKSDYITEILLSPNKNDLPVITYKFFDNESSMIIAYKLGNINKMTVNKKSVADNFTLWKNTVIEKSEDYSKLMTIFLNLKHPLLKEKEVRQAIAMSINRQKLIGYGNEAFGPIPPISWAYNQNLKKNQFDLDTAIQIMKKYKDSTESAKINFNTYYEYLDTAEIINKELNNAGIDTNFNVSYGTNQSNFDMLLAYWKVPYDPDQYYFWHSTQTQGNITKYKNLKVDKLLEDGRSTSVIEDRKKIYEEFQKVINDDIPAIFIFYPHVYTIRRK